SARLETQSEQGSQFSGIATNDLGLLYRFPVKAIQKICNFCPYGNQRFQSKIRILKLRHQEVKIS
ncbi:MAG TPA: hypothetical protein DEP38_07730, partial [Cyanobacteria bacterium UBA9226]|nr:hypothetical protein [Cyanobacteria bacterium UBA9226]